MGVDGISISMPTIVGRRGIEEVLDLPLSDDELGAFQASARTLKERYDQVMPPIAHVESRGV